MPKFKVIPSEVHRDLWRQKTRVHRLSCGIDCMMTCLTFFCLDRHTDTVITFRASRRRREMYIGHAHLCVSVCLPLAACPHYCTDPDVTWRNGTGCPLVVHCWAHLQSVHGFRCYDNIREREMSASTCTRSMPVISCCHIVALPKIVQFISNRVKLQCCV